MWVRARAASSKETVSSVPAWFRANSGTNLFKQGEIVAQRLECSHGKRETLGSSPGRATFFFLACDIETSILLDEWPAKAVEPHPPAWEQVVLITWYSSMEQE